MASRNHDKWDANYHQLKDYISLHHQLPDKKKQEDRGLLNWWKYNKRLAKQGKLDTTRMLLLQQLSDMREVSMVRIMPDTPRPETSAPSEPAAPLD